MERLVFNPVRAEQITHCSAYDKYSSNPKNRGFKPAFVQMIYEPVWIGSSFKCVYIQRSDIQDASLNISGNRIFGTPMDLRIVDKDPLRGRLIVARADGLRKITYGFHSLRFKVINAYFTTRMKIITKFLESYKKAHPPLRVHNPKGVVVIKNTMYRYQIAANHRYGVVPGQQITVAALGKPYHFTVLQSLPEMEMIVATNAELPDNWNTRKWTESEINHLPEFGIIDNPKFEAMQKRIMNHYGAL